MNYESAKNADTTGYYDFISSYVGDLENVLDIDAIRDGRACTSAPTRWAAPRSATGRRSPSGCTWT